MARPKSPRNNSEVPETSTVPTTTASGVTQAEAIASPPNGEVKKARARKTPTKPEIVKAETRSNLVPINLDEEIRRAAYLLSERRGFEPGHESEDWIAAEREVLQRYHQHSA